MIGVAALIAAGLHGATGVAMAAVGAHMADSQQSDWLTTGSVFQLVHAAVLPGLAAWTALMPAQTWCSRLLVSAIVLLIVGPALFAGALYGLALGAPPAVQGLAPWGGGALVGGWVLVAVAGGLCRRAQGSITKSGFGTTSGSGHP